MAEEKIKFPLSKKLKAEYSEKYEQIFMRKPVHNITDEKLVEMVNSHPEILKANENTQSKSEQEGIQNEEGERTNTGDAEGNETGSESSENNESGNLSTLEKISEDIKNGEFNGVPSGSSKVDEKQQAEREYQFGEYERLFGVYPDSDLSTDAIRAKNLTQQNLNEASKRYFDLFGKQPLPDMTIEQITSSVEIETKRQEEARQKSPSNVDADSGGELDFDPNKQMLIVSKKDKNHKQVINKQTFEFLKGDFDEVVATPKELQNFKK